MPNSVTLGDLKKRVRELSDMSGSLFVGNDELANYINLEGSELYDLLITKYQEYMVAPEYQFSLVSQQENYTLPDDFYKLDAVDIKNGADWIKLQRFMMGERNAYQRGFAVGTYATTALKYRLIGNNIRFVPIPQYSETVRMWYVPQYKRLADDSDKICYAFVNGWEDFIICGAASRCLIKEESDASQVMALKAQSKQRIIEAAVNRDANSTGRVQREWRRRSSWGWR